MYALQPLQKRDTTSNAPDLLQTSTPLKTGLLQEENET